MIRRGLLYSKDHSKIPAPRFIFKPDDVVIVLAFLEELFHEGREPVIGYT